LDEFEKLNIQIIDQLILGCTNYLNQSPKKYGQTGLKRSTDFKNELEKLKNSNKLLFNTKLTELVYKLFTNNQIGLKKYSDFLGFGGTIRTEETSLFTFCANSLINMNSFQNIILEKSSPLNNSALISALLNSPLNKSKITECCLKRFYLKSLELDILPNKNISKTQSIILLKSFQGLKPEKKFFQKLNCFSG
jgi:hypothetical protein